MTKPRKRRSADSMWKLGGLTLKQLAGRVFDEMVENNLVGRAAELAYFYLFALFPLILLMVTLFGMFAAPRAEVQRALLAYLADFVPRNAFQILASVTNEIVTNASSGKLTFGILSALWVISSGVTSMISALNQAHHVRESRSWLKVRAIALGLSVLASTLLLAALFLAMLGTQFVEWFGKAHRWHPVIVLAWEAVQWPAAILFVGISCSLIYYYGPDLEQKRHWTWFTPGSVFGAVVWFAVSLGLRFYLHFFNSYSRSYGSLGAVMVLLVWLYLTGLAYLIGGEINAEIERATQNKGIAKAAKAV